MPSAPDLPATLLLGADVGGTNARVQVWRDAGAGEGAPELLARADGPGYNRNSSGPEALAELATTCAGALATARSAIGAAADAARVVGALGIAGAGPAHHAEVQRNVRAALAPHVPDPAELTVLSDMDTAFAAGSVTGDGILLLAGTGSAGVRFEDFAPVERCDGMGWLLGDTGSAVWIGRRVLEAAAADLDGRGPATRLTAALVDRVGLAGEGDPRQPLIAAVHRLSPAQWGSFAPLAELCAGDALAETILEQAAEELIAKVDAIRADHAEVVATGSVLSRNPVIARRVEAALAERGLTLLAAADPLDGALRLARRSLAGED